MYLVNALYILIIYSGHRRRLLEITVGARFPSSPSPPFPTVPASSLSHPSPFFLPLPPLSLFPRVCPFLFYLYPLKPAKGLGSTVSSQWVWVEPSCQMLLVHFQTEINA